MLLCFNCDENAVHKSINLNYFQCCLCNEYFCDKCSFLLDTFTKKIQIKLGINENFNFFPNNDYFCLKCFILTNKSENWDYYYLPHFKSLAQQTTYKFARKFIVNFISYKIHKYMKNGNFSQIHGLFK